MNKMDKKLVFVGLSGGVDSSVAAYLLKKEGYGVVGVFMRCYNLDGCAQKDAEDARRAAEKLEIPFYVWDFEKEYKKKVVEYMVSGYKKGITPNPDVMCNKEIKFGLFFDKAIKAGADFVATGHYVRLIGNNLFEAKDKNKDQSYFLWTLTKKQLERCLFPIGSYLKPEVREIAKKAGLPTAEKKDSQGICFLGQVSIEDFLKEYIPEKEGDVILDNKKIGTHKGAHLYTIGQRHIRADIEYPSEGGGKDRKPYYVAEKDVKKNIVVLAEGENNPALYKKEIELSGVNFINPEFKKNNAEYEIMARVRYRQPLVPAKLTVQNKIAIRFKNPVKFVAPGQSAVFYDSKGQMLGGGIIR